MKKFNINVQRYICILLCLVLYITVLPISVSAEKAKKRTVRVGWYEGTYNTTGPDGKKRGYSYEYQQVVAAHTGWKYEYVEGNWAELMNMLKSGEIDLMGGIFYAEERSTSMLFSELPMGEDKYYLYVNPSDTDISASDLTTLNEKRIGVVPDSLSARRFYEWEKSHGVDTQQIDITSTDDARQKMQNQEIDGFVSNESPQWERDNISPALLIGGSYNYFAVNKKRPDLKEELDQAMQKIVRENPFYIEDLYKRYLSANSLETLTDEEQNWLEQHGAVRIGYLKNDVGVSLVDEESEEPTGIINDYISLASDCLEEKNIEFQTTGFDSQEEELQALKENRIDMIFHMNQNPYEAEQNDIILSNTVFEVNVAVLTGVEKFDENGENTVAVSKNNLLGKWYISFNYPFWKIKEYDSSDEVEKAVHSGEADCFVVKAGQSLKTLEDSKMHSVFLTKSGDSCFAVTRENTTLMNILNKTIQTLPASRLSSLFSVYENTPGKVAGTGLGMPIIKQYIDMMGGTIEAESKLGEGSRFTVTLEYRIADKKYYEQDTEKASDMNETDKIIGKHILLAEDNDLNAEIAEFILEDMGLLIDRVEDGIQCVAKMEQEPAGTYDLILMDIQMPNMNGYKATEVIRGLADKSKATIPIIAMTANAFEEDRKKAFAKGMNGHIAKPVDAEKVKKIILSVLR